VVLKSKSTKREEAVIVLEDEKEEPNELGLLLSFGYFTFNLSSSPGSGVWF